MKKVVVVGGGLAGLAATMKLAEKGCHVTLISVTKVKRSHSVCAQGGINAAMNLRGKPDSPYTHAYDTIKGGDFLADQPPVLEMCLTAPKIIEMMANFGTPFNRTPEGNVDFRGFGGTLYHRTAFCGASTGQQLLYTLDEQVRRYEVKGLVEKYEHHEFMRLIQDENGRARGVVVMDLITMNLQTFEADAVIFGVGGPGLIFKKSTNSTFCTGAANGRLYMQGVWYANGEFIQIHPTAIPGDDKLRLISESVRAEGGRMWVWADETKEIVHPDGKTKKCVPTLEDPFPESDEQLMEKYGRCGKKWFFLEEMYPKFKNLVPRDIGAREVLRVCELGMGIDGKNQVYLDVSHLDEKTVHKLESVLEIYRKFTGEDPRKKAMRIFPAVHYSMGGAWVDWPAADDPDRKERFRQMTNIPGCFEVGESEFLYHGANRLGANSLLSCIFGGLVAGNEVPRYIDMFKDELKPVPKEVFDEQLFIEESFKRDLLSRNGTENVHALHDELSDWMIRNVTVKRHDHDLKETIKKIKEIRERYKNIKLDDQGEYLNQTYTFANQFRYMIELALVMTKGALLRCEFRGAHFKPEYPKRDDKHWLKTTRAMYHPDEPQIDYLPIDIRHLDPILRDYSKEVAETPLKNLPPPELIQLPI